MHFISYRNVFAEVCSSPYVTNRHAMNTKAEYFKTGHEVSFFCNEGFSSPHSTTTCQATKVWSPQPMCTEITCAVPHLGNGRYNILHNSREANEIEPYKTFIIPVCNDGYARSSFIWRKCGSDGLWSKADVYCNPITCERLPDTYDHGYYDSQDTQPPFPYNHEITAVCHSGYHLTQPATRRCIEHNMWSEQYPECRRIKCRSPTTFSNGQYNGSRQIYDFGSALVPTCHTGYYMSNNVEKRVCERHNSWSGTEPKCEFVECETPTIFNGNLTPKMISYKYRVKISIQCDQGYEIKDGSETRTCQENGTWDQPHMECVKFLCNDTSDIRHAAIHLSAYPSLEFGQSGNVTFNSTFFNLQQGSVEVTCTETRKLTWVTKPDFGMILYC